MRPLCTEHIEVGDLQLQGSRLPFCLSRVVMGTDVFVWGCRLHWGAGAGVGGVYLCPPVIFLTWGPKEAAD